MSFLYWVAVVVVAVIVLKAAWFGSVGLAATLEDRARVPFALTFCSCLVGFVVLVAYIVFFR